MKKLILILLVVTSLTVGAQNSLHIGAGNEFYISAGTTVSFDGLALTPSSPYKLTGMTNFGRHTSVLNTTTNASIGRVYRWSAVAPAFSGTIRFSYGDGELHGLTETGLALNVHNGNQWSAFPSVQDMTANFVTASVTGLTLNELTLANALRALPLRWISAEARHENGRNHVNWVTASETGCKNYQVQKSLDGSSWKDLLPPVNARNTAGPNHYQLTDPETPAAVTWYRIRQNDLDGRSSYSVVMTVRTQTLLTMKLYPNPATSQFTLVSAGKTMAVIQVFNAMGSRVQMITTGQASQYTVNCSAWAAGTYRVQVSFADGSTETHSLLKER